MKLKSAKRRCWLAVNRCGQQQVSRNWTASGLDALSNDVTSVRPANQPPQPETLLALAVVRGDHGKICDGGDYAAASGVPSRSATILKEAKGSAH